MIKLLLSILSLVLPIVYFTLIELLKQILKGIYINSIKIVLF